MGMLWTLIWESSQHWQGDSYSQVTHCITAPPSITTQGCLSKPSESHIPDADTPAQAGAVQQTGAPWSPCAWDQLAACA